MHNQESGRRLHHDHAAARSRTALSRLLYRLPALVLLFLLAACASPAPPTLVPAADTPVVANIEARSGDVTTATPKPEQQVAAATKAPEPLPSPSPTATFSVTYEPAPLPDTPGIRPDQARLYRQPNIGPEATLEWRPPPYSVPLSLHPDDHYWLIRPLPSGSRNYDLEYYPYGNDVLIPEYGSLRIHRGLDFPNPPGTPVLAASSGTVVHAGVKRSNIDGVNYYGNTVIIKHDWQWRGMDVYTLYAHTMELFVEEGDYVEQGQLIAAVGATGIVSGPHLHLEVRLGQDLHDETRNPMLWIAPYEGWGTLAGRVIDREGKFITGAIVEVRPLNVDTPKRSQYTYLSWEVVPDPVWQENFVIGDLPAGRYEVTVKTGVIFRYIIDILPGRTNFLEVQTSYVFAPATATPTPDPEVENTEGTPEPEHVE